MKIVIVLAILPFICFTGCSSSKENIELLSGEWNIEKSH